MCCVVLLWYDVFCCVGYDVLCCGVVWYVLVRCGVVWCYVLCCGTCCVWYGMVWYDVICLCVVLYYGVSTTFGTSSGIHCKILSYSVQPYHITCV